MASSPTSPRTWGSREAGAAPLAAVTALAAMEAVDLGPGDTVLIVGASGGVGSFAAQLARRAGARVIAPALSGWHRPSARQRTAQDATT
jgi:NADPH:quinone reductase